MERSFLPAIAGYISRPRLDALMEHGLRYPLVFVAAGPGYGKSLSAAHFMRRAEVRLLWLCASSHRAGADDFWEDFVSAAARELPDYAQRLKKLGFPAVPRDFEEFRKITAETAAAGKRLVFAVDNYERIRDEGIIEFTDRLIESDLRNFSLFILCGVPLPLAEALPAAGQFRITDKHLAFDLDEAKRMFAHYGHKVSDSAVKRALKATGGWPLGLRLVCETDPERPGDFSSRTPIQIAADLHEQHYFKKYPRHIQTKLILFSLLPRFSPELAREGDEAEDAELHDLLMRHPFAAYDYAAGLFTFQPMYREFLWHKQTLVDPESRQRFQAEGGRWFLARGMVNEAMDCFWEAGDYDSFLESISHMPKVRHQISLTGRVLQRLERIPQHYADSHPLVDYCIAFMYLNAADVHRARELLLEVEGRVAAGPESDERRLLLGDIYVALADISVYQNEDTGLEWMKKAYELIPHGSRIHTRELYALVNNSVFFLPRGEPGELERMVAYFMEYAEYADSVKNGCGYGCEYLFAGEAAYYRENMDEAIVMFNSAILKAKQTAQHDIVCNALLNLARIDIYYGNHKNALALLGEMETYIESNDAAGLHELLDCARAFVYMRLDDPQKVPSWLGEAVSDSDELLVSLGRKQIAAAYYLYLTGRTARACALALRLEARLAHKGRWCEKLRLHMLMAQYHMAAGEWDRFYSAFKKAYDMVYHNNIRVALSAYGKDMMAMIDRLRRMDMSPFDPEWLEEVHRDSLSFAKRLQMMRRAYKGEAYGQTGSCLALTPRENETLRYLAQGLTQPEIAKLMGISVNAVKKHVSKIYYKLGAVNRADAIHIASINGLVDVINH